MRTSRWKRIVCAACLSLAVAGAYRAAASAPAHAAAVPKAANEKSLVHGRRVLKLGGYELNVAFTPGGRPVCFDITTS